jgi:hypothetical protein
VSVPYEIYTDHKIFWVGGIDYHRKQCLWRYDEENNMVLDKVDLSDILEFEEYVLGLGLAGEYPLGSGNWCLGFCTNKRWLRINLAVDTALSTDILASCYLTNILDPSFQVAGCTFNQSTGRVTILDSTNRNFKLITEAGAVVGYRPLTSLEEVDEGTLHGIKLDLTASSYLIGNRNYVMRVPATFGASSFVSTNVDRITYTRNLLLADIAYHRDQITGEESVVTVNDVTDRLHMYPVEYGRGGIWQQPYVADAYTVGLYHLDGTAVDASANGYDGINVGMSVSTAGRFGSCYQAAGLTEHISLPTIGGSFNGQEGSVSLWVKASVAGDLTSGTHRMFVIEADANNKLYIRIASGQLLYERVANGISQSVTLVHPKPDTKWHNYEMMWSVLANEFKAYLDGEQIGTTKNGLVNWFGAVATAAISDSGAALYGYYDEVRVSNIPRVTHAKNYAYTTANRMHALSGRSYSQPYVQGDPIGFFYRDQIYTPKFMGGSWLIRNDFERERLFPLNKVLVSGETIFRGPDPLPVLGDIGRLCRMFGLMMDRVIDDRHMMLNMFELLQSDVDFFESVASYLGVKGLDDVNWNVDKQRRFLRIMSLIYNRGATISSYRILAKLLGFYCTVHTLQARRRWDSVYYHYNFDTHFDAIPLDMMGSMDTYHESYPLARLRFIFFKLSQKSSTGVTSIAANRILTDPNGGFEESVDVGSLIVVAPGQLDYGDGPTDNEYRVVEVHSDTELKVDKNWHIGNNTAVTYYNYWQVPVEDPDTEYLMTRFLDIAPDSMRVERYVETL